MIALTGLISCMTLQNPKPSNQYKQILISEIPPLPSLPPFPVLNWRYEGGRYCIGETDVDELLDYGENQIPLYLFELEQYTEGLSIIIEAL